MKLPLSLDIQPAFIAKFNLNFISLIQLSHIRTINHFKLINPPLLVYLVIYNFSEVRQQLRGRSLFKSLFEFRQSRYSVDKSNIPWDEHE